MARKVFIFFFYRHTERKTDRDKNNLDWRNLLIYYQKLWQMFYNFLLLYNLNKQAL